MKFVHECDDTITITVEDKSHRFPLSLLLALEPEYSLPSGATSRIYIVGERHSLINAETQWGGEFPWLDGDRYIDRLPDLIRLQKEDELENRNSESLALAAKFDALPPSERRALRYPSKDDLVVALWKHIVEGKDLLSSGIQILQEWRLKVKKEHPDLPTENIKTKKKTRKSSE